METIELVSFELCPFVQRARTVLLEKNIPHKITYIDLMNKPEWFLKISPTGKVPLLKYGEDIIFESNVICEFLDEITPNSLHPADPIAKAKNRSWIEFASTLIMKNLGVFTASNQDDLDRAIIEVKKELMKIEPEIKGNFFNGDNLSIVDAAFAPSFRVYRFLTKRYNIDLLEEDSKLSKWSDNLFSTPSVERTVTDRFDDLFDEFVSSKGFILSK